MTDTKHIAALIDLRIGVKMDRRHPPDGDAKLAAIDSAISALKQRAVGEPILRINAEGSLRTITEWLDGAVDLPDGGYDLYAAPQASAEVQAEQFIQAAIDRAPEPLRRLGEYLTRVLDEDQWKAAERMLLGAAAHSAKGAGDVAPCDGQACVHCEPGQGCNSHRLGAGDEWRIDHTAGRPILVYQNCSVIEAEQAEYVLQLIRADRQQRGGIMDEREAFEAWWCSQDEGSIQFDLQQYPEDLKATLTNLWITAWQACQAAHKPDGGATRTLHHYGDVLQPFVHIMADELLANAGKGDRPGWLSCSADALMLEVYYHAAKLQKAVKDSNRDGVREYSADVANLAMMVLDVCGGIDAAIAQQRPTGSDK